MNKPTYDLSENATRTLFADAGCSDTLTDYIASSLGDPEDFDIDAIEDELRSRIQEILPQGVTFVGGMLFADEGQLIDIRELRNTVDQGIDFWAIAERHQVAG